MMKGLAILQVDIMTNKIMQEETKVSPQPRSR